MQGQERKALQLSVAQILAGALASVSAAVVASVFGVAGTLIGAALTSVVATVGGAVYAHSIERAHERVGWRRDPRTGAVVAEAVPPAPRAPAGVGRGGRAPWGAIRWLGATSALVFLLAMGALTAVEAVARMPVARLLGRAAPAQAETTVGAVFRQVASEGPGQSDGGGGEAETTPEATPEATPETTPTVAPTRAPAGVPTATATAARPTPTKAEPAPTVTTPAKGAPTPRPAATPTPTPGEDDAPAAATAPAAP